MFVLFVFFVFFVFCFFLFFFVVLLNGASLLLLDRIDYKRTSSQNLIVFEVLAWLACVYSNVSFPSFSYYFVFPNALNARGAHVCNAIST